MLNALSVDLEEWFTVSAFSGIIDRSRWPELESRVDGATDLLLDLFDRHDVKATFFVLGWVGERNPAVIRRIAERGHELASHGYGHELVYELTPERFHEDVARSIDVVQQATGQRCIGYRAPSFSLKRSMSWAWRSLAELGIEYDSSIFPIHHDRYGEPDAPRFSYRWSAGSTSILEIPPSTIRVAGKNIPVGGGGYLRLFPLRFSRWSIARINREGHPAVVYLHPWELDYDHPRPAASGLSLLRHRVGIRSVERKLDRLLADFRFGPLAEVVQCGAARVA